MIWLCLVLIFLWPFSENTFNWCTVIDVNKEIRDIIYLQVSHFICKSFNCKAKRYSQAEKKKINAYPKKMHSPAPVKHIMNLDPLITGG